MIDLPRKVTIVEVGPRDGLQNEPTPVPSGVKLEYIRKLIDAGLRNIEATSFVHPERVPQLADADSLFPLLPRHSDVVYSALVPNVHGLERAVAAGVRRIAVFTAASETFTLRNIGMTIDESLRVFREVMERASQAGLTSRGYVSTAFVCPYEGNVAKERVREVAEQLLQLGVDEIAISDTIGAAAPSEVLATVGHVLTVVPVERVALHFHATYGTAQANVLAGLMLGVATFDSSCGGLGGCPFAPGAAGNLATEDLVYLLHRMGIQTGVDQTRVIDAAQFIAEALNKPPRSALAHQPQRR